MNNDLRAEIEELVHAVYMYGKPGQYEVGDPNKPTICRPDTAIDLILQGIERHDKALVEAILSEVENELISPIFVWDHPDMVVNDKIYKVTQKIKEKYLPKEGEL